LLWVSWPTWAIAGSTNRYPEHLLIHYSSRLLKSKL
jgi:hypothetical protein